MSASLVRKALDDTLASEEKLDHISKRSNKRFKPVKKHKKISKDKLLKQNLKILKTLEQKVRSKSSKETRKSTPVVEEGTKNLKKPNKEKRKKEKNPQQSESVFTEEDFEKFEKEYFVTS